MGKIRYRAGYKYQLDAPFVASLPTAFKREYQIVTKHIWLSPAGILTVHAGYAWDGPSGPVWDSRRLMRASLVHDALYQLLRRGYLDRSLRKDCDRLFKELCMADGVRRIWAKLMYRTSSSAA